MTPRRKINFSLLFALACALAVTVVSVAVRGFEPSYHGQTISEWGEYLGRHPASAEARAAVKAIGQPGLEYLWREYTFTNSAAREHLGQWLTRFAIPGVQLTPPHLRSYQAYLVLRALGPDATPLIPRLAPMLEKEELAYQACSILAAIGHDGCAAIARQLPGSDRINRRLMFEALDDGPEDALIPVLRENDTPAIRALAMDFFTVRKPNSEAEVRYLADCLRDPDPRVRGEARHLLEELHNAITALAANTNGSRVAEFVESRRKLLKSIPSLLTTNAPPAIP